MKCYTEISVTVILEKDIEQKKCGEVIGNFINYSMLNDAVLKNLHTKTGFKFYSFDNLYPLAENGVYISNRMYTFRIRIMQADISNRFYNAIKNTKSNIFRVMFVTKRIVKQKCIEQLISLTPIIVILKKDCRDRFNDKELYSIQKRIINTLVKKYNHLNNENLTYKDAEHMFELTKIKSNIIPTYYKNVKLLGIKYEFNIAMDKLSQDLAFIAEATGLGEKNTSVGAGFCHANYLKISR